MLHHSTLLATAALTLLTITACISDEETPYAQRHALFRFTPVTAAPKTLLPALNNPGEWCTIVTSRTGYTFTSITTHLTDTYTATALDQYGKPLWVAGLIIGTPTTPEIGTDRLAHITYDLACPSCFENGGITRPVTITDPALGLAECTRCRRTYDLQNSGIVIEGAAPNAPNPRLYRYRSNYYADSNTFAVQN